VGRSHIFAKPTLRPSGPLKANDIPVLPLPISLVCTNSFCFQLLSRELIQLQSRHVTTAMRDLDAIENAVGGGLRDLACVKISRSEF
jgi:hypothetical protein